MFITWAAIVSGKYVCSVAAQCIWAEETHHTIYRLLKTLCRLFEYLLRKWQMYPSSCCGLIRSNVVPAGKIR